MSRVSSGERVVVKPTNNVYTVLSAVGVVVSILAIVAMMMKAKEIMPPGIF